MVDLTLIAGAVSSLQTAASMARGLVDIRDGQLVQAKVIELQQIIVAAQSDAVAAQSQLMVLLGDIRELQDKLALAEAWEQLRARYQLRDYGGGTFAYELKEESADGDPIHRICPNCFESKKRSLLQFQFKDSSQRDHYKCVACDKEFEFGVKVSTEARNKPSPSAWT